jgi:death on curing protein
MEEIVYFTKKDLLQYYGETILQSGGGMAEVRDEGGLNKVLDFIRNDDYYPTFEEKLTYLVYGLCHGHYFADGNKRISLVAGAHFLIKNRRSWAGFHFLTDMEAYIWHVAAGNIDMELLGRIIRSVIGHTDMDEGTKLDVINAMQKSPLFSESED